MIMICYYLSNIRKEQNITVNMGKCDPLLTKKASETYLTCLKVWTETIEIHCNC